jgi:hypothetical protein
VRQEKGGAVVEGVGVALGVAEGSGVPLNVALVVGVAVEENEGKKGALVCVGALEVGEIVAKGGGVGESEVAQEKGYPITLHVLKDNPQLQQSEEITKRKQAAGWGALLLLSGKKCSAQVGMTQAHEKE